MKKTLIKGFRGMCCITLVLILAVAGVTVPGAGEKQSIIFAEAASTTGRVPMWAYMKNGSGKLTTYTTNALTKSTGYIVPGDYCKILAFYSNGSVKVSYPTARGTKTAYAAMSGFMISTDFSTSTRTLGKRLTAYRRGTGNSTIGTVYATDKVIVVGNANGRTQVQYPCSGGYKLGWVAGIYSAQTSNNNTGSFSPVVYNGTKAEIEALCFDAKYYADTYSDLKAAFGYDSAKLLNHWKTCGIKEGRGASPILDLTYYMANNVDLRKAFGDRNYSSGYEHFLRCGYAEFRPSSQYYNGDYYRKKYTDLQSYDSKFLLRHYIQYGIKENRFANNVRYVESGSSSKNNSTYSISGNLLTVNGVVMSDYRIGGKYTNSNYAIVNGKQVYMAGSQCCGYARYIAYKLYGCHDKSAPSKFKDVSGYVAAGKLTTAKMKNAVIAAGVGSHIRTNGSQHSLAIIGVTDSGFTITDANSDGKLTIRVATYTWSSYVNSKYGKRGLAYIKKYIG